MASAPGGSSPIYCPFVGSSLSIYILPVRRCSKLLLWPQCQLVARHNVSASSKQLEFEEFCRIFQGRAALMNVEFGIESKDFLRRGFEECGKITLRERSGGKT